MKKTEINKTDLICTLSNESKIDNFELKIALRSVEKNFVDCGDIYIVGYKPTWIQNIKHVEFSDNYKKNKDANLIAKILYVIKNYEVTDNFVFLSDDQLFTKKQTAKQIKICHQGKLKETIKHYYNECPRLNRYRMRVERTLQVLTEKFGDKEYFQYEAHCPVLMNKDKFVEAMSNIPWNQEGLGVTINTAYFNQIENKEVHHISMYKMSVESKMTYDELVMLYHNQNPWYIGYNDGGMNDDLMKFLLELFPQKSKYEI